MQMYTVPHSQTPFQYNQVLVSPSTTPPVHRDIETSLTEPCSCVDVVYQIAPLPQLADS